MLNEETVDIGSTNYCFRSDSDFLFFTREYTVNAEYRSTFRGGIHFRGRGYKM
jgi:hypothetical protein